MQALVLHEKRIEPRFKDLKSKPSGSDSVTTKGSSPVPELLIPTITNKDEDIYYMWGRYRDKEFEENASFIYKQVV